MTLKKTLGAIPRDYYGGGLMILVGLAAVVIGLGYSVGSLARMGPGYFPVGLGVLLVLTGVAIVIGARLQQAPLPAVRRETPPAEWRGWSCIVGALFAFIVLAHYGGFVPASAAVVFISAMGDHRNTRRDAALLALAMVAVLVLVFWWGLKMTFPLFGWGNS